VDLFDRVEEELATLPGVTAVTSAMVPLLADTNSGGNVSVEGFEPASDADAHTYINLVGSEFLRTFDIPLLAGRDFSDADSLDRPKVAIVNETFAEHFGLYPQPVGKRIGWGATSNLDVEIIGVARDAKYSTVKREIEPQLFLPRRQSESLGTMSFYVRSLMGAEALMPLVPQVVARVDPSLPVTGMRTLENQIRENVFADRFAATLAASLAALATLLAALGLYGVFSYLVAQRTREMGLRLALGAPPQRLRGMLLRQVVWLALAGGSIGIGAALLVGRSVRALLFGLAPTDPLAILGAAALLGAMVLGAGYWPARRAAHIDPMAALRCD
jgi:predicted permease